MRLCDCATAAGWSCWADPSSGFFPRRWHCEDTKQDTRPMRMKITVPTQNGPELLAYAMRETGEGEGKGSRSEGKGRERKVCGCRGWTSALEGRGQQRGRDGGMGARGEERWSGREGMGRMGGGGRRVEEEEAALG